MNKNPRNTSFTCPHCGIRAQFNIVFPPDKASEIEFQKNIPISTFDHGYANDKHMYQIWRCQVCRKLVFRALLLPHYGNSKYFGQFPSSIRIGTDFHECVPQNILEDFESAIKCFEFGEWRASAAMCRRSLQSSMLEQGASEKDQLISQIDGLNKDKPDRFTNDIKDWAHNIRIFGNWGAHPKSDRLKDVGEDTANEIIVFMKSFFQYVYEMPKRVASAQNKQDNKKDSK